MSVSWHINTFDELPSTQDHIKSLDNLIHGCVVQADIQTAGYGRHGRVWISQPGNLFLSCALTPAHIDPKTTGILALGIGVALARTVKAQTNTDQITVKWPNDVLIEGRKCAGLLIERHDDTLIIGIGLNIKHAPRDEAATCIHDHGCSVTINTVRDELLTQISSIYELWENHEYTQICESFRTRTFPINTPMSVKIENIIHQGKFHGVDDSGALLLKDQSGNIRRLTSGQVFITD